MTTQAAGPLHAKLMTSGQKHPLPLYKSTSEQGSKPLNEENLESLGPEYPMAPED